MNEEENAEKAIEYISDHLRVMRDSFGEAFPNQRLITCAYITGFGEHRESYSSVSHTKTEDGDIPDALFQWANAFGTSHITDSEDDDSTWLPYGT